MGTHASTFYVLSHRRVQNQMTLWTHQLPGVKPFYAVKCNPESHLMTWLHQHGAGFDCASVREVKAVQHVARDAEIIFANPCKKKDEVIQSSVAGVSVTVIDSHEEVDKLQEIGWGGVEQSSLIRLRVEDKGSMMPFSAKFGLELEGVECLANYAKLKDQNINGISFHVGSGCQSSSQYKDAITQVKIALGLLKKAGHEPTTVDIGGGFMTEGFDEAAEVIREAQSRFPPHIKFIAEPGRFFAATCQDLFVRVIGKKPAGGGRPGWRYTLDESLYGQFSCIPFDHAQPRWIRVREKGEEPRKRTKAVLYGRTCDSVDFIAAAEEAEELVEGDWLWFPHMGAYTTVTSTEFNGFPKPDTFVVDGSRGEELPQPTQFLEHEWPRGLKYVTPVKVPELQ
jgi:ornithine decarboxylase